MWPSPALPLPGRCGRRPLPSPGLPRALSSSGKALARLHDALGYRVVKINFLGDWGTQFGKLMAGWLRW